MSIRNHAQEAFSSTAQGPLELIPRQRFNYRVELVTRTETIEFLRVQSVSAPNYTFDTQIANQYNKKRVVQTKINYDPVTIVFYDTYDDKFLNLFKDYTANYYNSGNGLDVINETAKEVTDSQFTTNFGFTPTSANARYFFEFINIEQVGQDGKERTIILKNPMITQVQHDTLDYSDSNPVLFTATFQPESIHID